MLPGTVTLRAFERPDTVAVRAILSYLFLNEASPAANGMRKLLTLHRAGAVTAIAGDILLNFDVSALTASMVASDTTANAIWI